MTQPFVSKRYFGTITPTGRCVVTVNKKPLNPRLDLRHYAHEFSWGKSGPGTQQLALALLADMSDDRTALDYCDLFADRVVVRFTLNGPWTKNQGFFLYILMNLRTIPLYLRQKWKTELTDV